MVEQGIAVESRPLPVFGSAAELMAKQLLPTRWVINGLLPAGTTLFASPSKTGKSWMMLKLLLQVAEGLPFWGHKTTPMGVLYLALEDSEQRLQSRMDRLLDGRRAPEHFFYATRWAAMDDGFFEDMNTFLMVRPQVKIVVIDTLQKVRGLPKGREGDYARDYREMGSLKSFFDDRGMSLILVHHTNKLAVADDPYDMISGTTAIMGAADTIWLIPKGKRECETRSLHIIGRDVNQQELTIRLQDGEWECLGDADAFAEQQALAAYKSSPIVRTIKQLLRHAECWRGKANELMTVCQQTTGYYAQSTTAFGKELQALIPRLEEDGIHYTPIKNGTGSLIHVFSWSRIAETGTAEQIPIEWE